MDPNNANAYFRMGQAANAADNTDAAEEAFIKAKELDESIAENVDRQPSTVYIKKAVACQRAKDLKGALENAQKSIEFGDNANAQKIVGLTALGLKQNAVAAEALKAYLAMSPDARDRVQIIYQLGTALIGAGQTEKPVVILRKLHRILNGVRLQDIRLPSSNASRVDSLRRAIASASQRLTGPMRMLAGPWCQRGCRQSCF